MTTVRPARQDDLSAIFDILYEHEIAGEPDPPPRGEIPASLRRLLATGTLVVAEQDGALLGYAGAITRAHTTYLTDLFVRPPAQSAGLGATLLAKVFPPSSPGRVRFTLASTDPRALALYVRAGLRPQWPQLLLLATAPPTDGFAENGVDVVEAQPGDPALIRWDADIGGRERSEDHRYWIDEEGGIPLWFRRRGTVIGYGYARTRAHAFWHPEHIRLGPIGARTAEEARACVLAAVRWAGTRARVLRIDVPGPHPCLAPLLAARFRITYVETFLAEGTVFDPERYVGSGDSLV